jgi:1-acyl-sn-glycerol-3-phosphate acyltransferase
MDTFFNLLYKLVAFIIRWTIRLNGELDVKGKENIPRKEGAIIAANHISYLDPPLIGAVVPRRATFIARKGLFEIVWLGWLIKQAAFPIDREQTRPSTIKEALRRLKKGELLVMFPEGRRSDTGEFLEAKRGIGMLVSLSKVPVVPTLIAGSEKALPVDAKWLKRAKISVVFDKPIYYTSTMDVEGRRDHLFHETISNDIMTKIRELKKRYGNES